MSSDIASSPVRERGDGREEERTRTELKLKAGVKVAHEDKGNGKSDKIMTSNLKRRRMLRRPGCRLKHANLVLPRHNATV